MQTCPNLNNIYASPAINGLGGIQGLLDCLLGCVVQLLSMLVQTLGHGVNQATRDEEWRKQNSMVIAQ